MVELANSTLNINAQELAWMDLVKKLTVYILYVQMIASIVLNMISLCCIVYSRAFTTINLLIINLCVAEILYASSIPFVTHQYQPVPNLTLFQCQYSVIVDMMSMISIVYTISALTLERYTCLKGKKTIHQQQQLQAIEQRLPSGAGGMCLVMSRKTLAVLVYIALSWTLSLVVIVPKLGSIKVNVFLNTELEQTVSACEGDEPENIASHTLMLVLAFVIPYTIIITFSIMLLRLLNTWYANSKYLHSSSLVTVTAGAASTTASAELSPLNSVGDSTTTTNTTVGCCGFFPKREKQHRTPSTTCDENIGPPVVHTPHHRSTSTASSPITGVQVNQRFVRIVRRSIVFVLAVDISFVLTWMPFWLYRISILITGETNESIHLMLFNNMINVLTYCEGIVSPLLFIILTENFREYMSKIVNDFTKLCNSKK